MVIDFCGKWNTRLYWDVNKMNKIKAALPSTILIWKCWTKYDLISKYFDFFTHFLHCFLVPQYIKLMVKSCVYVSFVIFWECKWGEKLFVFSYLIILPWFILCERICGNNSIFYCGIIFLHLCWHFIMEENDDPNTSSSGFFKVVEIL